MGICRGEEHNASPEKPDVHSKRTLYPSNGYENNALLNFGLPGKYVFFDNYVLRF
jgi:hypothetical protein